MKEVTEFLIQNPVQFLATAGLDNKPKVRPFQFMFEYDNKLWFCTGRKKEVYAELQKSPYIELSVLSNNMKWLRISIEAEIKNKDCIFVYSPAERGIFAFKYVKTLDPRPINKICSVGGTYLGKIDNTNFGDFGHIGCDPCCIEMRIEIEREKKQNS